MFYHCCSCISSKQKYPSIDDVSGIGVSSADDVSSANAVLTCVVDGNNGKLRSVHQLSARSYVDMQRFPYPPTKLCKRKSCDWNEKLAPANVILTTPVPRSSRRPSVVCPRTLQVPTAYCERRSSMPHSTLQVPAPHGVRRSSVPNKPLTSPGSGKRRRSSVSQRTLTVPTPGGGGGRRSSMPQKILVIPVSPNMRRSSMPLASPTSPSKRRASTSLRTLAVPSASGERRLSVPQHILAVPPTSPGVRRSSMPNESSPSSRPTSPCNVPRPRRYSVQPQTLVVPTCFGPNALPTSVPTLIIVPAQCRTQQQTNVNSQPTPLVSKTEMQAVSVIKVKPFQLSAAEIRKKWKGLATRQRQYSRDQVGHSRRIPLTATASCPTKACGNNEARQINTRDLIATWPRVGRLSPEEGVLVYQFCF
jgi:hypothetical protein